MSGEHAFQPKLAWANKFQRPAPSMLMGQFGSKQLNLLVEAARGELASMRCTGETLLWQGVPWRWSFVYTLAGPFEQPHPLAYLIPEPTRPQVAVPLTGQMIESLPMRRLKRFVRDGIMHSRLVGNVHWPSWDFTARSQLDEIMDLVLRKHKMLVGATQVVAEGA